MKKRILFETAALVLLLGLMLASLHAQAAIGNADVLDDILTRYQTAASAWATIITERASRLFWVLIPWTILLENLMDEYLVHEVSHRDCLQASRTSPT